MTALVLRRWSVRAVEAWNRNRPIDYKDETQFYLASDVDALLERVRLLLADAEMCEEPQCKSCRKCIRLALSELEPK